SGVRDLRSTHRVCGQRDELLPALPDRRKTPVRSVACTAAPRRLAAHDRGARRAVPGPWEARPRGWPAALTQPTACRIRRGERCCVRQGGAQMHEERRNGGKGNGRENDGPEGSDYGEPGFGPPGMGGHTAPMPGQSMPGPAADMGDEMPAMERPAAPSK